MSDIKTKVMRRVYMVTYIRRAISPFALKCYTSLVALFAVSKFVWVAKVFENAPSITNPVAEARFVLNAFTGTELAVQALILALTIVGVWLIKDIFSSRHSAPNLSPFLSRAI